MVNTMDCPFEAKYPIGLMAHISSPHGDEFVLRDGNVVPDEDADIARDNWNRRKPFGEYFEVTGHRGAYTSLRVGDHLNDRIGGAASIIFHGLHRLYDIPVGLEEPFYHRVKMAFVYHTHFDLNGETLTEFIRLFNVGYDGGIFLIGMEPEMTSLLGEGDNYMMIGGTFVGLVSDDTAELVKLYAETQEVTSL